MPFMYPRPLPDDAGEQRDTGSLDPGGQPGREVLSRSPKLLPILAPRSGPAGDEAPHVWQPTRMFDPWGCICGHAETCKATWSEALIGDRAASLTAAPLSATTIDRIEQGLARYRRGATPR